MKRVLLCVICLLLILNTVNVFAATELVKNFDDSSYTFPAGTAKNAGTTVVTFRYDADQKQDMQTAVSEGKWLQISTEIVVPANAALSNQLYLNGVKSDGTTTGGWINHTMSLPVEDLQATHSLSYLCDLNGKKVYVFLNGALYTTINTSVEISCFGESIFAVKYIGDTNTTVDYTVQYNNMKTEVVSQSVALVKSSDVKVNESVDICFALPVENFSPVLKVGTDTVDNLISEPESSADKFNWSIYLADGAEWEYETTYEFEYDNNTYSFTTEDTPPLEINLSKTSNVGVTENVVIQFSRAVENADEYIDLTKNNGQIENYTI